MWTQYFTATGVGTGTGTATDTVPLQSLLTTSTGKCGTQSGKCYF